MNQRKLTLWILWGAMLMSLVVYGVMPLLLVGTEFPGDETAATLAPILVVLGLGLAVASFVLRRLLLDRPLAAGTLDPETPEGAQQIQVAFVVAWVLSEAVGIFGFVLWFLGRDATLLYGFLVASAGLLALHAPLASRQTKPPTLQDLASGRGTIG
jgi:hypothetical protein